MKIGVVGAGAVGGFFGAFLQKAGHQVTFLARGKHLEASNENGLLVKHGEEEFKIHSNFTDDIQALSDSEVVLFSVKSNGTKQLGQELLPILNKDAKVVTMQNGVDNEEILTGIFGVDRVISCATYIQSAIEKPGVIKQSGRVKLVLGELDASIRESCSDIVSMFQQAGIETGHSRRIVERKWSKLLWNITFNPLSAISTATVGEILDDEHLMKTATAICTEAIDVALRIGVDLDRDSTLETTFSNAERARNHATSMLQDRMNGKPMEVEAICGYILRKAEELNIDTPTIQMAYSILNHLNKELIQKAKDVKVNM